MADIREQIIARLLLVANVSGVNEIRRNQLTFSDGDPLPAMIVMDGDEEANAGDPRARPSIATRRVAMTPEIRIVVQGSIATVGTELNNIRLRLIKAVIEDAELRALTSEGESVWYDGCAMVPSENRTGLGILGVRFTFAYYLKYSDL